MGVFQDRLLDWDMEKNGNAPEGQCFLTTNAWDEEREVICWQLFYLIGFAKSANPNDDEKFAFGHWIMPHGWKTGIVSLDGLFPFSS